ncbi:MAG: hypothetical protein ACFFAO_16820 [Candidatus Hermodarchaeota archaeon]
MVENKNNKTEFGLLLNSISATLSYDILKLYNESKEDYNLTKTAEVLNQSISTIQEYLKKLTNSYLIYKIDKNYKISNFGSYILNELRNLEMINKLAFILGKIPREMIPYEYLHNLIPNLKDIEIEESTWHFMSIINDMFNQFKKGLNSDHTIQEIKLLGWWNLNLDYKMVKTYFKDFSLDIRSMKTFFEKGKFRFKIITDKKVIDEILEDKNLRQIMELFNMFDNFRIYDTECFNFTIIEYSKKVGLFLIEDDDFDMKHHILFENNPAVNQFFEPLFNYYWQKSIPITDFINK